METPMRLPERCLSDEELAEQDGELMRRIFENRAREAVQGDAWPSAAVLDLYFDELDQGTAARLSTENEASDLLCD